MDLLCNYDKHFVLGQGFHLCAPNYLLCPSLGDKNIAFAGIQSCLRVISRTLGTVDCLFAAV